MKLVTFITQSIVFLSFANSAYAQETQDRGAPTSPQAEDKRLRPYIPLYGANFGYGQVLSEKTRQTFGKGGFTFSPGFGPVFAKKGIMILPGLDFLSLSQNRAGEKNKALLVSIGPSVRYGMLDPMNVKMDQDGVHISPKPFSPYAEIGMRLVYADVTAHLEGISSKRVTYGGVIILGTGIQKNAFIQVKLTALPKIESYNFSSATVEFGVRF